MFVSWKINDQVRWEYLKYEIRKFSIHFSISEAEKRNEEMNTVEKKMKTFKENLTSEELFSKKKINSNEVVAHYSKDISLPKLTTKLSEQWESETMESEVKNALGNMVCNKTPGNDGRTSEFYEVKPHCCYPIKKFFVWRMKHFSKISSY